MFDRAHCIWGQAGIVASICRLDLSYVDMADDIVMYGHILSHNVPEKKPIGIDAIVISVGIFKK